MKRSPLIQKSKRIIYWSFLSFVIGYSLWTMIRAIHKSYLMNGEIKRLKNRVEELKVANENLNNLIVYYQTNTFKELEARSRLNLKKPGERVYIIPDHQKADPQISISPVKIKESATIGGKKTMPNYQKWWQYIWNGEVD